MDKKKSWAIIISVISLATAVTTATFLICKNFQFGVGIDEGATFVGICTSLIGVFATVILGLQIWNHLEFSKVKDDVKYIEILKGQIEEAKYDINVTQILINGITSDVFGKLANDEKDFNFKLCYSMQALIFLYIQEDENKINYDVKIKSIEDILKNIDIILINVKKAVFSRLIFEQFKNKAQSYPSDMPNYAEIMKKHYDIVLRLEKLLEV